MASSNPPTRGGQMAQAAAGAYAAKQSKKIAEGIGKQNKIQEKIERHHEEANRISVDIADSSRASAQAQMELVDLSRESLGVQYDQLKEERQANLWKEAEYRRNMANDSLAREKREIKRLVKERTSHMRDILFQSKKKSKDFLESNKHPVEKFFLISSLNILLKDNLVSTGISDSFEDKEYIDSAFKKIEDSVEEVASELSNQEVQDIQQIYQILEVTEEYIIEQKTRDLLKEEKSEKKLKQQLSDLERNIPKTERDIERAKKQISDLQLQGPLSEDKRGTS
tara:strand:+ start:2244 stop:3089 length:846 start_codon:yes stop_codon:yes gene_type:complete